MTERCEACPARDFCVNIIQDDMATIERRHTIMGEIGLSVLAVEMAYMEGHALIDTHIAELENSSAASDDEDIGSIVEKYANLERRRHTIEESLASIHTTADHLTIVCQEHIRQTEAHLVRGQKLQELVALGCEQGTSGSECNAPGAKQLLTGLGAVPLPLPDTIIA